MPSRTQCQERVEDAPIVWFSILERAWRTGDFEAERHAVRELERLGVTVHFDPKLVRRRPQLREEARR
jgi:hypothetical protein